MAADIISCAACWMRGLAVLDELRQEVGEIEFPADPTTGEVSICCNELLTTALLHAGDRATRRATSRRDDAWVMP